MGFNDTSTVLGHFVSTPREWKKRDRRDSGGDTIEGHGRKRNRNESEETEKMKKKKKKKNIPPLPLPAIRIAGLAKL